MTLQNLTWSDLLAGLKGVLIRGLTSLKVWTTVIGLFTTWLATKNIAVTIDPTLVAAFFALLLGGQAVNDAGAKKATIQAAANKEAQQMAQDHAVEMATKFPNTVFGAVASGIAAVEPKLLATNVDSGNVVLHMSDGTSHDITDLVKPLIDKVTTSPTLTGTVTTEGNIVGVMTKEGGFISVALMFVIAAIGALVLLAGCTKQQLKNAFSSGAHAAVKCGEADLKARAAEQIPSLVENIKNAIDQGTGKVNWPKLDPITSALKSDAAGCALTAAVATFVALGTGSGAQGLQVDQSSLMEGYESIRKTQLDDRSFEVK